MSWSRDDEQFCPRCGNAHETEDLFCPGCGVRFDYKVRRGSRRTLPVVGAAFAALALASVGVFAAVRLMDQNSVEASSPNPSLASPPPTTPATTSSASAGSPDPSPTRSEPPADFAQLFSKVRSGVVRIDASTCDGGGIGTGFLVGDDLVVTAAHVVDGAASLGLTFGSESSPTVASGIVVGIDRSTDMAMIKADRELKGHVFVFSGKSAEVGQEVVAIGFPRGEPMTLTRGIVSGLNRTITLDNRTYSGLIQTDAAINPGNSGGPMVDVKGSVQGIADAVRTDAQGIAYAVPAETASRLTEQWRDNTTSVVSAPCQIPEAPDTTTELDLAPPSEDPVTVEVTDFFTEYFTAVNAADYTQVWKMLSPRLRPADPDELAESLSTTIDFGMEVHEVERLADDTVRAHVSFISTQASEQGPEGQTCTVWDMDYTLVPAGDTWQIRRALGHNGSAPFRSC